MGLRRFWIEFATSARPTLPMGTRRGIGVTAFSRDDALALVRTVVFGDNDLPPLDSIIEDVDVSTLDPGHVLPNMGTVLRRGIWFPLGHGKFP